MDHTALKIIHVSCVAVSFALFFGRGLLMLADSPRLNARLLRIAPHVNDTVLLGSAIWMAVITRQYPFAENWLTAKLVALVVYIGVGMIALSHGRTRRTRAIAWAVALLVFAYIVGVALSRNPLPFASR